MSVRATKEIHDHIWIRVLSGSSLDWCVVMQVKKLVQKMVTRDTLSYRKMTDKPQVKDVTEKDVTADVEMKDSTPAQEEKAELDEKTLAQGEATMLLISMTLCTLNVLK